MVRRLTNSDSFVFWNQIWNQYRVSESIAVLAQSHAQGFQVIRDALTP